MSKEHTPPAPPRCGVIGWPPLKKAIWDEVIATEINAGKYISAWDLTERIYTAALSATPSHPMKEED